MDTLVSTLLAAARDAPDGAALPSETLAAYAAGIRTLPYTFIASLLKIFLDELELVHTPLVATTPGAC